MSLAGRLGEDGSGRSEAQTESIVARENSSGAGASASNLHQAGVSSDATTTPAAPRPITRHSANPNDLDEASRAEDLRKGFPATRRPSAGAARSKIVSSTFRLNDTAGGSTARGARSGTGAAVGSMTSSTPASSSSLPVGLVDAHDPSHRRHWQKMSHTPLADSQRVPPVAARRAAAARTARELVPPGGKELDAAQQALRSTDATATTAAAAATAPASNGVAPALRSASLRLRRGGRSMDEALDGALAFQDAALVSWLNSVLFPETPRVGGEVARPCVR